MALYIYEAYAKDGNKKKGNLDAPSVLGARELLVKQGLYPISIVSAQQASSWWNRDLTSTVPLRDKILFTKQLVILLRASVPLLQAVDLLDDQYKGQFNQALVSIKDGLKEGQSLADGMKQFPDIFENIYIQLVRAGEMSGKLEFTLDQLVVYMERKEELRGKIFSAVRDPLIQLALILASTIFLVVGVVPDIVQAALDFGVIIPTPTRVLMDISYFLIHYYGLLLGIIGVCVGAFLYARTTPQGALFLDKIKLKIPIVGTFARLGAVVQFCSTLGMLLSSGVVISDALDVVTSIIDNKVLKQAIQDARDKIIKQGKITQYLKQTGVFPSIALHLIGIGEESGNLDVMLLEVSATYEKELSEKAETLSALIGPIMMVSMAAIVGSIVMAVMLPILELANSAG